jgi:hypothetical protein
MRLLPRLARLSSSAPLSLTIDTRLAIDPDVRVTAASADGRILLHTRTARMWVMNGSGAEMWDHFGDGRSLADVAGAIATKYDCPPQRVREDVLAFAGALVTARILRVQE